MNTKVRKIVAWLTLFIMVAGIAASIIAYTIQ